MSVDVSEPGLEPCNGGAGDADNCRRLLGVPCDLGLLLPALGVVLGGHVVGQNGNPDCSCCHHICAARCFTSPQSLVGIPLVIGMSSRFNLASIQFADINMLSMDHLRGMAIIHPASRQLGWTLQITVYDGVRGAVSKSQNSQRGMCRRILRNRGCAQNKQVRDLPMLQVG